MDLNGGASSQLFGLAQGSVNSPMADGRSRPGLRIALHGSLAASQPTEVTMDGHRVASGFRVKQPRRLIECRQVHSRSIDPRFISGDRRRDLIPFAAQGGGDVHSTKLEQNKNIVKENSEYPEIAHCLSRGKCLKNGRILAAQPPNPQTLAPQESLVCATDRFSTLRRQDRHSPPPDGQLDDKNLAQIDA
jgi:hypothetical protein